MFILGINAAFHDSSACLLNDGNIIAAAEEERFTGIKHGKRPVPFSAYELPFHAINYCLKEADIHLKDVSHIAYSFLPELFSKHFEHARHVSLPFEFEIDQEQKDAGLSPWDPLFYLYLKKAPNFLIDAVPHHLKERFSGLNKKNMPEWHFVDHHLSHAASCYFVSPFYEAAILIIDGRGESATTTYAYGKDNEIKILSAVHMPNSLGLLYERVTEYLGFLHSSDEYKVMAMGSFGKAVYKQAFEKMIEFGPEGKYKVAYPDLIKLFGPSRNKGEEIEQRHFNIANSLQAVLEESMLKIAVWLKKKTKCDNLCLAGGVALNCVMNGRLKREGVFKNIWIQPAAGDSGTALGAALWINKTKNKSDNNRQIMSNVYLGPNFSDKQIEDFLKWTGINYRKLKDIPRQAAEILNEDRIVGWFQGRMEYGPRALGARSIIASPLSVDMQARLNDLKDREEFRPVAPAVLEEYAADWFKGGADHSPFMLFTYDVIPEKIKIIPAAVHVDGSARIQTVSQEENKLYYDLIKAFYNLTGVPIIVNTSFNSRGKPIVCAPRDALDCFFTSPLDDLIIGSFLVSKNKQ